MGLDHPLVTLDWCDFPSLWWARARLTICWKDKKLNVFSWAQHCNGWISGSVLGFRAWIWLVGGLTHCWKSGWVWYQTCIEFSKMDTCLPDTGQILLQEIAKNDYICAQDIVDFINTPKMKEYMGTKHTKISVQTAHCWLQKLDWHYQKKKTGIYPDAALSVIVLCYKCIFICVKCSHIVYQPILAKIISLSCI